MSDMNNGSECTETVLIGEHEKFIKELEKKGIRCLILENNEDIGFSVRNHADMAAFYVGDGKLILDKRQKNIAERLKAEGCEVILTDDEIRGKYPSDVLINAAKIGSTVICCEKYISREILASAERIINVRQGYTKCSVCIVNENAFITDDKGIYEKCKDIYDVLLIEKGDIVLEGEEYGFIGGASAKAGATLYFFGSIDTHRDSERIKAFLEKHSAAYECLSDDKLTDIGGFICLE